MPDTARSIIVGGGIKGGTPFTQGQVPYISDDDPKTISASAVAKVVNAGTPTEALILGGADPEPTATEKVRVVGGLISEGAGEDATVIGRAANAGATQSIAIGDAANAVTPGAIAIGVQAGYDGTGIISGDMICIGQTAQAQQNGANGSALAIGQGASAKSVAGGGEQYLISIGRNATTGWGASIAIGHNAKAGLGGRTPCTAIGVDAHAYNQDTILSLGTTAQAYSARTIAIGHGCQIGQGDTRNSNPDVIAIGMGVRVGGSATNVSSSIVIGNTIDFIFANRSNVLIIGHGLTDDRGSNTGYIGTQGLVLSTLFVGRGATHTAAHDFVLRGTMVSGGNLNGGSFTIRTGDGSGTGSPGNFKVQVRNDAGADADIIRTEVSGGSALVELSSAKADGATLFRFDDFNNNSPRAGIGAVGTVNQLINGSTVGDLCVIGYKGVIRFGVNNIYGAPASSILVLDYNGGSPQVKVPSGVQLVLDTTPMRFNGMTNGAGASAGTLGNAPSAGDPTFWLKVNIGGVDRNIPCW